MCYFTVKNVLRKIKIKFTQNLSDVCDSGEQYDYNIFYVTRCRLVLRVYQTKRKNAFIFITDLQTAYRISSHCIHFLLCAQTSTQDKFIKLFLEYYFMKMKFWLSLTNCSEVFLGRGD
jgi:hypothetical protein